MQFHLVKENEDGSADYTLHLEDNEVQDIIRSVIMKALIEAAKEGPLYDPSKSDKDVVQYTEAEIAWVAGLLEGEGCFSICTRKSAKHDHKTLAIHCEMTDEDTIIKLHKITKVGTVNKRANTSGRQDRRERKPTWIWSVQNHGGIYQICKDIYPFMGMRRQEKIKELMNYVESRTCLGNT